MDYTITLLDKKFGQPDTKPEEKMSEPLLLRSWNRSLETVNEAKGLTWNLA